ncbi:MAG: hypothetical protein R2749_12820 [Acidimicrobiales bacterium]
MSKSAVAGAGLEECPPWSADMDPICNDLAAEHAADAIVADLTEQQGPRPPRRRAGDVRDTIVHIVQADEAGEFRGGRP